MAGAAGFAGLKAWRSIQAGRMARGATELLSEGKVREALLRAQSAMQLGPEEPEPWRNMARVMEAIGNPLAVGCYEKLVSMGKATTEDRERYVQAALRFGQLGIAGREASALAQSGDPGYSRLVAAEEKIRRGDTTGAEKELRSMPAASSIYGPSRLLLARLLAAKGAAGQPDEARQILVELSKRDDTTGAQALATALDLGLVPAAETAAWIGKTEAHPAGDERTFLAAQTARLKMDPASRDAVVRKVMDHFTSQPVERKTAALVWLNALGENDRGLALVSSREALSNSDAFVAWLDALAGKGDWARVEAALAGEKTPLRGTTIEMFRARAARMTGKQGAADQGYRRAVGMALSDPRQLGAVIAFLEADGQLPLLRDAMQSALDEPADREAAKMGLVALEKKSRDAAAMRSLYNTLRDKLPDDADVRGAHIHYDLVLGGKGRLQEAWEMSQAEPQNFARKAVYALGLLKEGKSEKAVLVFDGLSVRSDQITPGQKAIVVSVLGANGRAAEAQAMASTLVESDLTKEEAAMVNSYLGAGTAAGQPR